jgi:hypothetical protein
MNTNFGQILNPQNTNFGSNFGMSSNAKSDTWAGSPTPGKPVNVYMKFFLKAIQNVNPKSGTASVILGMTAQWTDPRVAAACKTDPGFKLPGNLWAPGPELSNGIHEAECLTGKRLVTHIVDKETGTVGTWTNFAGVIDNPMELHGFPFDEDSIDFRMAGNRLATGANASRDDYVLWVKDGDEFFTFYFDRHLPEYQILGVSYVEYNTADYSYITFGVSIRRKQWYYFFKVTILMWMIVLLSMPIFLFRFDELEQRMTLTATMFLATAATLYVVGQDLPKTEKLHKMDKLLLGTISVIFGVAAETVAVRLLHEQELLELAEDFQLAVIVLLITSYVLLNIYLFAWPVVTLCFNHSKPSRYALPENRVFLRWEEVHKFNPWGATGDAEIRTPALQRESPGCSSGTQYEATHEIEYAESAIEEEGDRCHR